MFGSSGGFRRGLIGLLLGGVDLGFGGLAMAWVEPPRDYPDVRLSGEEGLRQHATFDPTDLNRLTVAFAPCSVRSSADGGKTWGPVARLPETCATDTFYEPAIAYAADGSRLYSAYTATDNYAIRVEFSASTDHGATWSPPTIVFGEPPEYGYGGVNLATAADNPWIYVTASFGAYHGDYLLFSSSEDGGLSWTPDKTLADSWGSEYGFGNVTVAAGRNGNVLVAHDYYESAFHALKLLSSSDHGASFASISVDERKTPGFYTPDINIGPKGTANLVYSKAGAVLYSYSVPPYKHWTAPARRLDNNVSDANARSPRVAVGACGHASILHATWVQSRNGKDEMLYSRRLTGTGYFWSRPLNIGLGHVQSVLIANDLAAAGANAFATFGAFPRPLLGSRVWSGGTCP